MRHEAIRVCQACVRRGKRGIFHHDLLEQLARRLRVCSASPIQPCARLEIENVGIDIEIVAPLARAQRQPKLVDDRPGDFILDGEDVVDLSIEGFGPHRNVPCGLNQLGFDAHPVAGPHDGPLDDQIRSELLANLLHVALLVLECRRRRSRADLQALNGGEAADDFVRQPIDKIVAVPFRAEILERQHGDNGLTNRVDPPDADRTQSGNTRKPRGWG